MDTDLEAPVYPEIDRVVSWYGFQLDDLAALVFMFWIIEMIVEQAHVHVGSASLTLPLSFVATGMAFMLWRSVKANQPRHFLEDALGLAVEPEAFEATPDAEIRPAYVIEPGGGYSVMPQDPSRRAFHSWTPEPLPGR